MFNKKGYAGTSLADLTKATGLTKGSIYGNFKSKDEVAVAVFRYNIYLINRQLSDFVQDKTSAREKLIGITEYYRTNWKKVFEKGGCPIQNASVEADDNLDFLKEHIRHSIKKWVKGIGGIIEEGQRNGEFRKKIVAGDYAYIIMTLIEGGIMLGKIMNDHELLFTALDRAVKMIEEDLVR